MGMGMYEFADSTLSATLVLLVTIHLEGTFFPVATVS